MDRKSLLELYPEIVTRVRESLQTVAFNPNHKQTLLMVALTCSIAESASSVYALLENEHYSAIPVLMRSTLEAHIDLKNLHQDSNYWRVMMAAFAQQEDKFFSNAAPNNPFYNKLYESGHFDELKARNDEIKNQYQDIINDGQTFLTKRFEKAGEGDLYYTIYNRLCRASHNNVDELGRRHIQVVNEKYQIALFSPVDDNKFLMYVDTMAALLIDSAALLFDHLGYEDDSFLKGKGLLAEMRKPFAKSD